MLQSYCLFTSEADIPEIAVAEILEQLQSISLCANTVGIVCCHHDFVLNDILPELVDALPFELVGFTSFYQSCPLGDGLFSLSITVLTSDDVRFSTGANDASDNETPAARLNKGYQEAMADSTERPSVVFNFMTQRSPITGDEYMRTLDALSGAAPCFGAVAIGDGDEGENVFVIRGDQIFNEGFALLLLFGEVQADFLVGTYREESLMPFIARVTESNGTLVKQLNEQPAQTLLESHGTKFIDNQVSYLTSLPYLFQAPESDVRIGRVLMHVHDDGALEFLGEIPQDSRFYTGTSSTEEIMKEAYRVTREALLAHPNAGLILMFSCLGRFSSLGLNSTAELDHVKQAIPDDLNYLAAYAGGEYSPVMSHGKYKNYFHNSSFVVCTLS